jgi:hypothetical protein
LLLLAVLPAAARNDKGMNSILLLLHKSRSCQWQPETAIKIEATRKGSSMRYAPAAILGSGNLIAFLMLPNAITKFLSSR